MNLLDQTDNNLYELVIISTSGKRESFIVEAKDVKEIAEKIKGMILTFVPINGSEDYSKTKIIANIDEITYRNVNLDVDLLQGNQVYEIISH